MFKGSSALIAERCRRIATAARPAHVEQAQPAHDTPVPVAGAATDPRPVERVGDLRRMIAPGVAGEQKRRSLRRGRFGPSGEHADPLLLAAAGIVIVVIGLALIPVLVRSARGSSPAARQSTDDSATRVDSSVAQTPLRIVPITPLAAAAGLPAEAASSASRAPLASSVATPAAQPVTRPARSASFVPPQPTVATIQPPPVENAGADAGALTNLVAGAANRPGGLAAAPPVVRVGPAAPPSAASASQTGPQGAAPVSAAAQPTPVAVASLLQGIASQAQQASTTAAQRVQPGGAQGAPSPNR